MAPVQLWVIAQLEIVVRDSSGTYLLLQLPSYAIREGAPEHDPDEGHWTLPYVGHPVDFAGLRPTTPEAILELFGRGRPEAAMRSQLDHMLYRLGISSAKIGLVGGMVELKASPRFPEQIKCFKILRFGLLRAGQDSGLRSLTDPEARLGFVHLPLDHLDEVLTSRASPRHRHTERWFRGKPLISTIDYLLNQSDQLSALRKRAIPLRAQDFWRDEQGLLCAADLAGYGKALRYARDRMHGFGVKGDSMATQLRTEVMSSLDAMLSRLGLYQVHLAGDGFIAAFPGRVFDDLDGIAERLVRCWLDFLEMLEHLNSDIQDPGSVIGSRMALHYGPYRYGRIGLARSITATLDGTSIVEVARLEQALALAQEQQRTAHPDTGVAAHRHTLVISDIAYDRCRNGLMRLDRHLRAVGRIPLVVKEFQEDALVYYVSARQRPPSSGQASATTT